MLLFIHVLMIALFLILGVVLFRGKGAFLIAGYNTSSKEQKSKTDEKALCRAVGKMMFALAGTWCVVALGSVLEIWAVYWTGIGLFLAVIIAGVVYMNTGHRFERK